MTHISDTNECKRLARNVVTADFDTTQIESWQDKVYSRIATLTDKDDWNSGDREYGALQAIETELVAAQIIKHYGDTETIPIWMAMKESAEKDLTDPETGIIANLDTETTETDSHVDRTEFKGWIKNTANEPPNRLGGSSTDTESF